MTKDINRLVLAVHDRASRLFNELVEAEREERCGEVSVHYKQVFASFASAEIDWQSIAPRSASHRNMALGIERSWLNE